MSVPRTVAEVLCNHVALLRLWYDKPNMTSRPAVFLDRDGTLNVECGHLTRPEQMQLLPGAAAALRGARGAGFACVVVTNQSAVGRGLLTEADLRRIHDEMLRQLHAEDAALDGLYHCPAAPPADHPERKPAPGMLLRAARELGLDLARSWMIGDSARFARWPSGGVPRRGPRALGARRNGSDDAPGAGRSPGG